MNPELEWIVALSRASRKTDGRFGTEVVPFSETEWRLG